MARALQDRDWATRQLPRRPQLLPQLIQTVNDDAASARVMAAIIGQDPVLTGNLLRIANSPAYKVHERPVESLQRAVTLVGTDGVRQIISAVLVQPVMQMQCDAFPQFSTIIWEHALLASRAAADHARTVTFGDAFAAQWLGLVQGLGAALVMRQLLQEAQARGETVEPALALQLLQQWSLPLAQRVAAAWELPEPVHQALLPEAEGPLADSLRRPAPLRRPACCAAMGMPARAACWPCWNSCLRHRRMHCAGSGGDCMGAAWKRWMMPGRKPPIRGAERYSCDSSGSQLITRDNQRLRAVAPGSSSAQCGGGSRSSQRNRRRSSSASHQLCRDPPSAGTRRAAVHPATDRRTAHPFQCSGRPSADRG